VLTRVVAAFLKGNVTLHSHSHVEAVLREHPGWVILADVVKRARQDWADDMTVRRDRGTHYVALSAASRTEQKVREGQELMSTVEIGIPLNPRHGLSVWWDEVPVVGGTSIGSLGITHDDGTSCSAHAAYDPDGRLILARRGALPEQPEMQDGLQYIERLHRQFEDHIVAVTGILWKRQVESGEVSSGS